MKTSRLILLFVMFLGGVVASFVFDADVYIGAFGFLLGGALFVYGKMVRVGSVLFVSSLFILFSVGVFRTGMIHWTERSALLDEQVGAEIILEGVIDDEPDVRAGRTILVFKPQSIQEGGRDVDIQNQKRSRVRVYVDPYPQWRYGEHVRLQGVLEFPENFESDTGRTFNYVSYLAKDGIFYQMYRPQVTSVGETNKRSIKSVLFSIKATLVEKVNEVLPEPESSLAGGITLGAKSSLGEDLLDKFRITGIIHIVVLSGYNITIVADSIMRVLGILPRMFSLLAGSIGVVLFAIMTGAGATVVRASIMALLVVIARATGRVHETGRILLFAAAAMVLWNPYILLFDPSFQLSFVATLGLIYLSPVLERAFSKIPKRFDLRAIASATIAAQIAVLPLLLYQSGIFSTVSLPVNMLILPFVPLAMLASFLAAMCGFIGVAFAFPFGLIAYSLLAYMFGVVEFFAGVPFSAITIPTFPLWAVFASYGLLAILLVRIYRPTSKN